eukprot:gene7473-2834_t
MDAGQHRVECFQEGREWCGLAGQMQRILQNFAAEQWRKGRRQHAEAAEPQGG